jgi:hypothetical protein
MLLLAMLVSCRILGGVNTYYFLASFWLPGMQRIRKAPASFDHPTWPQSHRLQVMSVSASAQVSLHQGANPSASSSTSKKVTRQLRQLPTVCLTPRLTASKFLRLAIHGVPSHRLSGLSPGVRSVSTLESTICMLGTPPP